MRLNGLTRRVLHRALIRLESLNDTRRFCTTTAHRCEHIEHQKCANQAIGAMPSGRLARLLAQLGQLLVQHIEDVAAADHAHHLVGGIHHRVDLGLGGQHLLGQA